MVSLHVVSDTISPISAAVSPHLRPPRHPSCPQRARFVFFRAAWSSTNADRATSTVSNDQDPSSVSTAKIMLMLCSDTDALVRQVIKTPRIPSWVTRNHVQPLPSTASLRLRSVHPTSVHPGIPCWPDVPFSGQQRPTWCWTQYTSPSAEAFLAQYTHHERSTSIQERTEEWPDDDRPSHGERHSRQRSGPTAQLQV